MAGKGLTELNWIRCSLEKKSEIYSQGSMVLVLCFTEEDLT